MIIDKISAIQFDEQGKPSHQLETIQLIHYPQEDKNLLANPHIILSSKDQTPWHIQAKQGISTQKMEILTLKGDVILQQAAGANNTARTIHTEELLYYPKKQFATTQHPILLEQPGLKVNATGINAYMEQQQVELLSNVSIHYLKNDLNA